MPLPDRIPAAAGNTRRRQGPPDLTQPEIEDLMRVEVQRVFGASSACSQ
jgi:hypothetical protein